MRDGLLCLLYSHIMWSTDGCELPKTGMNGALWKRSTFRSGQQLAYYDD